MCWALPHSPVVGTPSLASLPKLRGAKDLPTAAARLTRARPTAPQGTTSREPVARV